MLGFFVKLLSNKVRTLQRDELLQPGITISFYDSMIKLGQKKSVGSKIKEILEVRIHWGSVAWPVQVFFWPASPAWAHSSCPELHWPPWASAEDSECNSTGAHLHTGGVMVGGWRMDFQQEYFFHALRTLNVEGHGSHREIFVLFLWVFLEAGNQKGLPFPQSFLGGRGLLRSVGKSNRYSTICVLYATTYIILGLPCLWQNIGSSMRKLWYQIIWFLVLGKVVVFSFVFFFSLFVLQDFRVPLQCVSHQMQNPLQDRWIFKTPQLFCCNYASRATVSL